MLILSICVVSIGFLIFVLCFSLPSVTQEENCVEIRCLHYIWNAYVSVIFLINSPHVIVNNVFFLSNSPLSNASSHKINKSGTILALCLERVTQALGTRVSNASMSYL